MSIGEVIYFPEINALCAATGDEEGAAAVLSSSEDLELLPQGEVVAVLQRSSHRSATTKISSKAIKGKTT